MSFLEAIGATVVAVDRKVARRAAQLSARHRSLRLPDALSLATALSAGAELLSLDSPGAPSDEGGGIAARPAQPQ